MFLVTTILKFALYLKYKHIDPILLHTSHIIKKTFNAIFIKKCTDLLAHMYSTSVK